VNKSVGDVIFRMKSSSPGLVVPALRFLLLLSNPAWLPWGGGGCISGTEPASAPVLPSSLGKETYLASFLPLDNASSFFSRQGTLARLLALDKAAASFHLFVAVDATNQSKRFLLPIAGLLAAARYTANLTDGCSCDAGLKMIGSFITRVLT
jgi:hypothetical protein